MPAALHNVSVACELTVLAGVCNGTHPSMFVCERSDGSPKNHPAEIQDEGHKMYSPLADLPIGFKGHR